MKNSVIISSVVSFISMICSFFVKCFKDSVAWKIFNGDFLKGKLVSKIKAKAENSFIINFFVSPAKGNCATDSVILNFFRRILTALRSIAGKLIVAPARKSSIVRFLAGFYSNVLNYSLRHLGIILCVGAVLYAPLALLLGDMNATVAVITGAVALFGVLCCAINTSAYNFFTGSMVVRAFGRFFGAVSFEERENIALNRCGKIACIATGVVLALASAVANPIHAIIFAVGILAVGWIVYDYTVGIFIATVVLAVSPTMALVGLIMLTFMSFLLNFARDEHMSFKRTALDIPLMLFAGVLTISAVTSFAFMSSVMAVMVYLVFILSYYLLTNSIRTKERLYTLIVFVLFVGLFVAAYGIYQHIFGFAEGTVWTDTSMFEDIETRVVSTFENPNVLGEYLLLLIPVCVGVIVGVKSNYIKLTHLGIVAVLSLCMIYTYSRGNWIGLLVAIFIFFAFYDKRFIWLAVVALVLSPLFLPQNVINRISSVGDMGDSSTSYRVYIWIGTLKMLKDYWFCGIGIGTAAFEKIYSNYALSAISAPHSHNLYLQIITENGIMGIITFAAVMVVYFKQCVSTVITCKDKFLKSIIIGLASGMLGYLVQGVFDNVWYNYRVFLLFFIILGITAVSIEVAKNSSTEVT